MATQTTKLAVTTRTEKGKGAARRARRAGNVPAVLYGHGTDPQHLNLPARELAAILRNNGLNAVIDLDIEGTSQLALTKQIDIHPIRNYIEHVDLLVIKRGEKVTVEVPVHVEGDAAPETVVTVDNATLEIEADVTNLPEALVVSVEGLEVGTQILAGQVEMPAGSTLASDAELLVINITQQISAEELEAELAEAEAEAGIEHDESDAEAAEGDAEATEGGEESSEQE